MLILVESPRKVADVRKYAALCGVNATVLATTGHLLDLRPMRAGTGVDPDTFLPLPLVPRDAAAQDRIHHIRTAIAGADLVVIATDADREGEAIASQLWSWIPSGKARRTTFEEITRSGIEQGLSNLRPHFDGALAEAALCRRVIDRLAGWHATAVTFKKLRHLKGVSAGRLQSAALRLVVERHRDHTTFKSTTTWGLRGHFRTVAGDEFTALLVDDQGQPRTWLSEEFAKQVRPPSSEAVVRQVDRQSLKQKPRPPFDATSWLQVAQHALGLSVKAASAATQLLFEDGHTTYPRTDSVRVSAEAIAWARGELLKRFGSAYVPSTPWNHDAHNAHAQNAHEAIRPTVPPHTESTEKRHQGDNGAAYTLIENRFLASQACARVLEVTTVSVGAGDLLFAARGAKELFDGSHRVLNTDAHEEDTKPATHPSTDSSDDTSPGRLPPTLATGDPLQLLGLDTFPKTTKPKPLFNQASLVAELRRKGIGRPSTYQSIVPLLLSRLWVRETSTARKKPSSAKSRSHLHVLVPTDLGVTLCQFLTEAFPSLVDYEFTANLEGNLDAIESGSTKRYDTTKLWWEHFVADLQTADALPVQRPERKDLGACPKCAQEGRAGRLRLIQGISSTSGKPYEFAGCELDTREAKICGQTARTLEGKLHHALPCPQCKNPMRAVRRKDGGHSWVCGQHESPLWYLAGEDWELVTPPTCPKCRSPLVHREKTATKGEFFWACFPDGVFHSADIYGRVKKAPSQPPRRPPQGPITTGSSRR